MTTSTQWQLARESAERYQNILTPTILGPFAQALVDFAALQMDERVVDVGCGTGAAARYAAGAVGNSGHVTGIDVNESMIEVARSLPAVQGAPIDWHQASATQLPLNDESVDVVLCAQTLQFLPEKQVSLSEMRRVVKNNGRFALSLWCDIAESPYFDALVAAISQHIGEGTSAGLKSAFAFSDEDEIHTLLEQVGFGEITLSVAQLDLPLTDLEEFVPRHISATPMSAGFNQADESVQRQIIQEITDKLAPYRVNGHVQVPFKSYLIMCRG